MTSLSGPVVVPLSWPAPIYADIVARLPELRFVQRSGAEAGLRRALERGLKPGASLLDIGCGAGLGACHAAASEEPGLRYLGIDPDPQACVLARQVVAGLPLVGARVEERTFQQHLAVERQTFDLVLWARALHECVDTAASIGALVGAAASLLVPGGHLVLVELVTSVDCPPGEQASIERSSGATVGRHGNGGKPHLAEAQIQAAFLETPLRLVERQDHPRSLLSAALGRPHARQLVLVYRRPLEGEP